MSKTMQSQRMPEQVSAKDTDYLRFRNDLDLENMGAQTSANDTISTFEMFEFADTRRQHLIATQIVLLTLAALSAIWIGLVPAIGWLLIVSFSNFAVKLCSGAYVRHAQEHNLAPKHKQAIYVAEVFNGLAWASLPIFALTAPSPNGGLICFAVLCTGIAVNALSARKIAIAVLVANFPATVMGAIMLSSAGDAISYAFIAFLIGAFLFFQFMSMKWQKTKDDTSDFQIEKDSLILELQEARASSDIARRQAEQANIAKSRFLATMSHELRTPLNAIIGFSEVLKAELLGPHQVPQYKEYAGDIHASGQHLLNLINSLLDLSRIEEGKYDLFEEQVNVVKIVDECRRMIELRARQKNLTLIYKFDEDTPALWGDERSVRQVGLNLLSNAVKFLPNDGRVTVKVGRTREGGVFISVLDNGPGIPENELDMVMSSFGQGSLSQKSADQGAGLGLPIVQKIMDLHQGRFDLFSQVDLGTEAIATFPMERSVRGDDAGHLEIYSEAS